MGSTNTDDWIPGARTFLSTVADILERGHKFQALSNATFPSAASEALAARRRLSEDITSLTTSKFVTSTSTVPKFVAPTTVSKFAVPTSASYTVPRWLTTFESTVARVAEQQQSFLAAIRKQEDALASVTEFVRQLRSAASTTAILPERSTIQTDLDELHDEARSAIAEAPPEIREPLKHAVEELEELAEQTATTAPDAAGKTARGPLTRDQKLMVAGIVVTLVVGHNQAIELVGEASHVVAVLIHYAMALLAFFLEFPDAGSIT